MKKLILLTFVMVVFATSSSYAWYVNQSFSSPGHGWITAVNGPGYLPYREINVTKSLPAGYSNLTIILDASGRDAWTGYGLNGAWPTMYQGPYPNHTFVYGSGYSSVRLRVHSDTYHIAQALYYAY